MDKLSDRIKDVLTGILPDMDVHVFKVPEGVPELRGMEASAYGDTAAELEQNAFAEAQAFFGEGPELLAEDGWVARLSGKGKGRYHAVVNMTARGSLTAAAPKPDAAQEAKPDPGFPHETDLARDQASLFEHDDAEAHDGSADY